MERKGARHAPPPDAAHDAAQDQAEHAARSEARARRARKRREAEARAEAVARSHPPAPHERGDALDAAAGRAAGRARRARARREEAEDAEALPPAAPPSGAAPRDDAAPRVRRRTRAAPPGAEVRIIAPPSVGDGRGALDEPEALPAGLPDRSVLSDEQRRRLRSQRKREKRRAPRSAAGKAEAAAAGLAGGAAAPAAQAPGAKAPDARAPAPGAPGLPARMPGAAAPPAAPADDAAAVFAEIQAEQSARVAALQRDIARRRRRRGAMLFLRLLLFVILPTALAGWWQYEVATPLYVSHSAFVVRSAAETPTDAGGGMAGAMGASPLAAIQDSISVQDYILSRDALDRLDAELGVIADWRGAGLDPLLRLPPEAGLEQALERHRKLVTVGYDPAESLIRMEVAAPDPARAAAISAALIRYAEEMIDGLSTRMRADMVAGAETRAEAARAALSDAHAEEAALKERLRMFSAESEAGGERAAITALETELDHLRARIAEIRSYAPAGDPRVAELQRAIAAREEAIAARRARIAGGGPGRAGGGDRAGSIAEAQSALARARAETVAAEQMFLSARSALEVAQLEAGRQISYLAVIVPPARADAPTRPRRAANTALAALAFFGIYLFASLTVSVLREQFSA
ncbi:hypothetical protein ACQ5SO_10825 [Rhodovulum sp. DZ06]|uniref:hypothetical protein n=1 Tax=Rhodovulum sp. DZ06 TaxID=3425126 RepID=UPI003D35934A